MNALDVGYKTYSIEGSKFVYGFSSLIDYDPASSAIEDSIGEHYRIFQAEDGAYLLEYRVRGQRAFGAPGFTAAEGFFPHSIRCRFIAYWARPLSRWGCRRHSTREETLFRCDHCGFAKLA